MLQGLGLQPKWLPFYPALMSTCKFLLVDASPIYYKQPLYFDSIEEMADWCRYPRFSLLGLIRTIQVRISGKTEYWPGEKFGLLPMSKVCRNLKVLHFHLDDLRPSERLPYLLDAVLGEMNDNFYGVRNMVGTGSETVKWFPEVRFSRKVTEYRYERDTELEQLFEERRNDRMSREEE